jgi:hypothetical protein
MVEIDFGYEFANDQVAVVVSPLWASSPSHVGASETIVKITKKNVRVISGNAPTNPPALDNYLISWMAVGKKKD